MRIAPGPSFMETQQVGSAGKDIELLVVKVDISLERNFLLD